MEVGIVQRVPSLGHTGLSEIERCILWRCLQEDVQIANGQ